MLTQVLTGFAVVGVVSVPRGLLQVEEDEDVIPGFTCADNGFDPVEVAGEECCGGSCGRAFDIGLPSSAACCDADTTVEVCCEDPRAQYNDENGDPLCTDAQDWIPPFPDDLARGREVVCQWTCCATLADCPEDPLIAPPFTCGQKWDGLTSSPTTAVPTSPTAPTAPTTGVPTTARPTGFPTSLSPTSPTVAAPTAPTSSPTSAPTASPTSAPTTSSPTASPTAPTTSSPTAPTSSPTTSPTGAPTDGDADYSQQGSGFAGPDIPLPAQDNAEDCFDATKRDNRCAGDYFSYNADNRRCTCKTPGPLRVYPVSGGTYYKIGYGVTGTCVRRCGSIGWERNRNLYRSLSKAAENVAEESSDLQMKQFYGPGGPVPGPYGPPMGMGPGPAPGYYNPYVPSYNPMMNPFYGRPPCDPYAWNSNWYWCQGPPPPPPGPPVIPTDDGFQPTYPDVYDCYRRGGPDCACSCDSDCTDQEDCCENYISQCDL